MFLNDITRPDFDLQHDLGQGTYHIIHMEDYVRSERAHSTQSGAFPSMNIPASLQKRDLAASIQSWPLVY